MGNSTSAIIFWLGDYGGGDKRIKQMRFPFLEGTQPSVIKTDTLSTALQVYTDADRAAYERMLKYTDTPTAPGIDANLDIKARIAFKDSDDGKVYRIELPAPKDTMFEAQGEGDRVKPATLVAIVGFLSTAYSRTFIPLWGKRIQRS